MARTVVLISANVTRFMGGEAIKAFQFAKWLEGRGRPFHIVTHARCREEMAANFAPEAYTLVEDGPLQRLIWASRIGRMWINLPFHLAAAHIVRTGWRPGEVVLHYINPISPVELRLPPKGYETVIGPLNGNIYYPPAFRARMSRGQRLRERLHGPMQRLQGVLFADKRRARALLISGGERTRASLRLAGCRDATMMDVMDSGVGADFEAVEPMRHEAENFRFVSMGRLVGYKGYDLAIAALARADARATLDIYGDGEMRPALEAQAAALGLADRVRFPGHLPNEEAPERLTACRAFLFPTLAEANGIVMQEAMMLGLPVIALNWGGPAALADANSAVMIEPEGEDAVIAALAASMNRLGGDAAEANRLAAAARAIAEARFRWETVAESWTAAYP